jgi:hypothetical protein
MKRRILQLLMLAACAGTAAYGQIDCSPGSSTSTKIVCQFPIATGVLVNQSALGGSASGANSAITLATGINIGIATQVSQLPIASASAGTVVVYKAGVQQTLDNLGPILTDRAQTIGKGHFFIGFTGSQFVFTDIDGISLHNLQFGYVQTAFVPGTNNQVVLSNTYTSEVTDLSFKISQFTAVGTFGLTDKLDFTVIVPFERLSLGTKTLNPQSYIVNANSSALLFGPYTPTFANNGVQASTAAGLGDVLFNGKYQVYKGEHTTLVAATSVRTPTGDDLNLLGSGAWGFNPYLSYSYLERFSPHARVGYQWNTKSELNNPTNTYRGNKDLPGGLQYDFGADWAAFKRVTFAADLLGNQYLNTPKVGAAAPLNLTLANETPGAPTNAPPINLSLHSSTVSNTSYTINNVSAGLKWRAVNALVLSGNVLFQINNTGLRARPTPLVGISYKF